MTTSFVVKSKEISIVIFGVLAGYNLFSTVLISLPVFATASEDEAEEDLILIVELYL